MDVPRNKNIIALLILGIGILAICILVLLLGNLRHNAALFIPLWLLVSLLYLAAICRASSCSRHGLFLILLFSVLFRLVLLFSEPTLSDDIYRYVWEGRLQWQGVNPYLYTPQAEMLASHRTPLWERINHKSVSSVYPPLSQIAFAVAGLCGENLYVFKGFFLIFDFLIIWLLIKLLQERHLASTLVLIYAWNPLVLIEVAGSGHHDTLPAFLLLLSIYLLERGSERQAVAAYAGAILAKLYPLSLLPLYIRRLKSKKTLILLPVAITLAYLPYAVAGSHLAYGLATYSQNWRFNDSLFLLLSMSLPSPYARVAALVLLVLIASYTCVREYDPLRMAFILIGATILLSPTVHPWYLLWIIPYLCLFPNRAWILLSVLTVLSYQVLVSYVKTGVWHESPVLKAFIYLPFYGLLLFDWARQRFWRQPSQADE